ncbi:MAG: BON domain-containing protein [Methylococcaceae bacterium]
MTKKVSYLLIFCCILTMTLTTGCSPKKNIRANPHTVADRRTADMAEIDKDIATEIKENLRDDEETRRFHVNVTVYNGAVLLTGEAMNEAGKSKIVEMARVVKHVKMVHDNLIVDYPSDNLSRSNDHRIAQSLKQALTQIHDLPNFDPSLIKIVVEQSSVYLMGRVHRNEGMVVINVVRLEPDIRQIITVFEYID